MCNGWLVQTDLGAMTRSWKKRWFVLSNLHELRFYKENKPVPSTGMGTIKLSNLIKLRRGDQDPMAKYPYFIEIATADRAWILAANNEKSIRIWFRKLQKAIHAMNAMNERKESQHAQV